MFDTAMQREIGSYTIHELVGWGGMSRVYRATDTSHQEAEVAIKVLSDSLIGDAEYDRRFMREIEIAGRLAHPHILTILGSGREQGVPFLVMPLVSGGTLADVLRVRHPLSPQQTLIIAEQIGAALDYIHQLQLVHRDIKPANILLGDANNYVLADFGLMMRVDHQVEGAGLSVMGSLPYMSPEQQRGDILDHRSDLFSLGLVLYECLTGRLPYDAQLLMQSSAYQISPPPITPRQISQRFPTCLEAPLLRGIEKDKALRFQSGHEMADALNAAIDRLPDGDAHRTLVSREEIKESRHLIQRSTSIMPD